MHRIRTIEPATHLAAALLAAICVAAPATAQTIERVSLSSAGAAVNADVLRVARPSLDGRVIAFSTRASNLAVGDDALSEDLFVRDRAGNRTLRIARNATVADVSSDGARVLYTQGAGPKCCDDPIAHIQDIASGADQALTITPVNSRGAFFSADGSYVVYQREPNPPPLLAPTLCVRRELASGTEDVVSQTLTGGDNTGVATPGGVSAGGSLVTFGTADANIAPNDLNGQPDAFYRDFGFGFSDRYSAGDFGAELDGPSEAGAVTPDTRFLLFASAAAAIASDANGTWDLYVSDRFFGALELVSLADGEAIANGPTRTAGAWISPDGTRVVFASEASNLVPGDANGASDVFERNLETGTTRRIVLGLGGAEPNGATTLGGASHDGRFLTILSAATNLVPNDLNGAIDAFALDRGPQCAVGPYCSALPNSTGQTAVIGSTGSPSFTLNNFVLSAVDLPDSAACAFFHGPDRLDVPVPFGDGQRCVGGTLVRLGTLNAQGGSVIQFQDLAGAPYAAVQPGDVRRFQLLYRDVASPGAGFNTTDALEAAFCP